MGMCYRRRGGVLSPEHCWWAGDAWRAGGASVPDQDALPVRAAARGAVRCQTLSGVPTQQPGMKHPGTSTRTGTHSRDRSTHINTEQNPITLYDYEVALICIFILVLYIHSQWILSKSSQSIMIYVSFFVIFNVIKILTSCTSIYVSPFTLPCIE